MRNYFILDGIDSRNFGVYISGQGTFSAPQKAYQFYNVPGRNGSLLGNEHRLENINVSYEAFIYSDFDNNMAAFRSFLLSLNGYKKLTDSYHPDEFRMAVYTGPFEPKVERTNDCGSFVITFSCKPQRFLFSGDTEYSLTSGSITGNPIYTDTSDIDPTNISIAVSIPYQNGSESQFDGTGYNYATGAKLSVDGSQIWGKSFSSKKVLEAAVNPKTGATITKIVVPMPTTGWVKDTGYGSVYYNIFDPGGTILACSLMRYVTSNPNVGKITYSSGKLIIYAPANRTTLDSFYSWFNSYANKDLAVAVTDSLSWTETILIPSGTSLTASLNARYYIAPGITSVITASVTGSNTLENPTAFPSKPLIRLYGNGTATVNGQTITVTNSTVYVDIDCDIMDCYEGTTNRNNDVAFSTYDFPELKVGTNTFLAGTGITGIRVTPRWWRV